MPLSKEIQDFVAQFGNTWNLDVNAQCEKFFEERQAAEPAPSSLKVEKAVHYGPDPRHRLDVSTASGTCPRHLTDSDILEAASR